MAPEESHLRLITGLHTHTKNPSYYTSSYRESPQPTAVHGPGGPFPACGSHTSAPLPLSQRKKLALGSSASLRLAEDCQTKKLQKAFDLPLVLPAAAWPLHCPFAQRVMEGWAHCSLLGLLALG